MGSGRGIGKTFRMEGVRAALGGGPGGFRLHASLDAAPGEVLGLLGGNGAGKSTLLRVLLGLVRHDAGRVEVLGHEMPREARAAKRGVAWVSEDMALHRGCSVAWHLELLAPFYPTWSPQLAMECLDRLGISPEARGGAMSRGQQVKALLAMALARRPRLLLLDEPTAGLDPIAREELVDALVPLLTRDGATVVMSSHLLTDLERIATRFVVLHEGRVVEDAPRAELLRDGRRLEDALRGCQRRWTSTEPGRAA